MPSDDLPLTPYVIGWPPTSASLAAPAGVAPPVRLDVLDPATGPFQRLLNAANALAFGALAMPAWVQLDCALLPSAYHGFALPRSAVPPDTWRGLRDTARRLAPDTPLDALDAHEGWVPVSGFCAARTPEPGTIVAFSLFSILRGRGLGVRSKALGLLAHGAGRQVGTTQYDNVALRVHAAFGPLEILAPRAPGHPRAEESFVYGLRVPAPGFLAARVADGRRDLAAGPAVTRREAIDASLGARLEADLRRGAGLQIVPPGREETEAGPVLLVAGLPSPRSPARPDAG